jgi:hypothetical protein
MGMAMAMMQPLIWHSLGAEQPETCLTVAPGTYM